MKLNGIIASTIAMLAFGACGNTETGQRINEAVDLQGQFQTEATEEISIRAGGVGCVVHNLDISLNRMTIVQTAYDDAECKGKAIGKLTTEGSIKIGDELAVAPGARALDFKIASVTITPLDGSWLTVFGIDTSGDCNVNDLGVGQTREITGLRCGVLGQMPAKDSIYFTSYRVGERTLEFTKLPNEASKHIGTEAAPAARNQDLEIVYRRL